jgi:NAD(P)-dependent dehydrogenase (short-subunit alcohol dehydrogenase family)
MSRVLITGSTTGLGLAAAVELIAEGHDVIVHAGTETVRRRCRRRPRW